METLKRALRVLGMVALGLMLAAVVGLTGLRVYWSDARLQRMLTQQLTDELGTPVQIGSLSVSVWHGVELHDVHIEPLAGFSHSPLTASRLAVHWSLGWLLLWTVRINEIAVEDAQLAFERNAHGNNFAAIASRLFGPPKAPRKDPEKKPASTAWEPFSWPIRVQLKRLCLRELAIAVVSADQTLTLDHLGASGSFAAFRRDSTLDFTISLGRDGGNGAPSRLTVSGTAEDAFLALEQNLILHLEARNATVLDLRLKDRAQAQVGRRSVPLPVAAELDLKVDLGTQSFVLETLAISVAQKPTVLVRAQAEHLFTRPKVRLGEFAVALNLSQLRPILARFLPPVQLAGELALNVEPIEIELADLTEAGHADGKARLQAHGLTVLWPGGRLGTSDLDLSASAVQGRVHAVLQASCAVLQSGATRFDDFALNAKAHTPLLAWMTGPSGASAGESLDVTAEARSRTLAGPDARARDVIARLSMQVPTRWPMRNDAQPLAAAFTVTAAEIETSSLHTLSPQLELHASVVDALAKNATASLRASTGATTLGNVKGRISLPAIELDLNGRRDGDSLHIAGMRLEVPRVAALTGTAQMHDISTRAPTLEALQARLVSVDLSALVGVLPEAWRPDEEVHGKATMTMEARGRLDFDQMHAWAKSIDRALPIDASWTLALSDVDVIHKGVTLNAINGEARLAYASSGMRLEMQGSAQVPTSGASTTPVSLDARAEYTTDGALRIERLDMEAPDSGALAHLDLQVAHATALAQSHAWKQAGLPGVTASLHWLFLVDARHARAGAETLASMAGSLDCSGAVQINDGVASLAGRLRGDDFSMVSGNGGIDGLTGELPFDLALAFRPQPDATLLSRKFFLGDGTLALLTADTDIRKQAARSVFAERLHPYTAQRGIRISRVVSGPFEIANVSLDARLTHGMLLVDSFGAQFLGGDLSGNFGLQIGRDASLRGEMALRATNIDASTIPALGLTAGPDSQLSADFQIGFLLARHERDLTLNANVTKIGSLTLDHFLMALDREGKDENIRKQRDKLWWFRTGVVRLDEVAAWIRYENLNVDLEATTLLRIPGTGVGYMPVPRELLRRYPLHDKLDLALAPIIEHQIAPLLGWNEVR